MTAGQLLARGGRNPPCQTPVVLRGTASKPNPANRPGRFGACREMTRPCNAREWYVLATFIRPEDFVLGHCK